MSTLVGDAPPFLFAQDGDKPSPFAYELATQGAIQPTASTATFDGSAAGSPFLACLSFYAQSGQLLSRVFPQTVVAAGEVAQVSYAPFPGGVSGAAAQTAIRYDVNAQSGDWLDVRSTAYNPNTAIGQNFEAHGGSVQIGSFDDPGAGSTSVGIQAVGDNNLGMTLSVAGDNTNGMTLETAGAGVIPLKLLGQDGGPLRFYSKPPSGYPNAELESNSVQIRAGDSVDHGAIAIETFGVAAGDTYTGILMGVWGFPAVAPTLVTNGTAVQISDNSSFYVINRNAQIVLYVGHAGEVSIPLMPTSHPGGSNRLWNNGGVVNIT